MTARTATNSIVSDVKYYAHATKTVTFSSNDTYTASEFISTANLNFAAIINNATGTEYTNSVTNNVITCTQAGVTNVECTVFIYGVRA